MFQRFTNFWENYGFEIVVVGSIVVIIILALFRIGKKGSYSSSYVYTPRPSDKKRRGPPTESKGERKCRQTLESIFRARFPKARPNFLNNPVTGGRFNLELDCFNPSYRLAVEYSGIQHYKFTPYFHKNKESFLNQKYRDDMKARICRENGINLIVVPYTVKEEKIPSFLLQELRKYGYKI